MKNTFKFLTIFFMIAICCTGCFGKEESSSFWKEVCGSYAREDSSQYSNGVLSMKYLGEDAVIAEIKLMEGSESETESIETIISGVMLTEDNVGTITYQNDENPISISFEISNDLKSVEITHTGELDISPDGKYEFTNEGIEASDESVMAILSYLPEDSTGLYGGASEYTINPPESLVEDWFYPVNAMDKDNETLWASFIIAKDMSSVYRVNEGADATLIYGSAKNMMEAQTYLYDEDYEDEGLGDYIPEEGTDDNGEGDMELTDMVTIFDEPIALVSVETDVGTLLTVGSSGKLIAKLPWDLPYTIEATSEDSSIVSVEGDIITAVSAGETSITGKIIVDDAQKDFSINLLVVDDIEDLF